LFCGTYRNHFEITDYFVEMLVNYLCALLDVFLAGCRRPIGFLVPRLVVAVGGDDTGVDVIQGDDELHLPVADERLHLLEKPLARGIDTVECEDEDDAVGDARGILVVCHVMVVGGELADAGSVHNHYGVLALHPGLKKHHGVKLFCAGHQRVGIE